MTRAEWDAMSPRERDALVAEKVMGWHRWDNESGADYKGPFPMFAVWDCVWFYESEDDEDGNAARFTTTPEGMMAVVEKMAEERTVEIQYRRGTWAEVSMWAGGMRGAIVAAPTLPEAVCLAAITALGHMEAP